ncbi:MAG: hypothetical protein ACTHNU_18065 [Gaiellales bacterium]
MTVMQMPSHADDRELLLGHEIDDLLLRLRGLVLVRDLLADRGASAAEIHAHAEEAERVRGQLANLIGPAAA